MLDTRYWMTLIQDGCLILDILRWLYTVIDCHSIVIKLLFTVIDCRCMEVGFLQLLFFHAKLQRRYFLIAQRAYIHRTSAVFGTWSFKPATATVLLQQKRLPLSEQPLAIA